MLAKLLLILLIFFLLLILVFNQNIPAFIYNEIEWKERADYFFAEDAKDYINTAISIRTGNSGLLVTDNQLYKLPEGLKNALAAREFLINDYLRLSKKQEKIPFLPKKYKEYQKLKTEAFENYKKGFETFKKSTEYINKVTSMVKKLDSLDEMLFSYLLKTKQWDPNLILANNLTLETQTMYDDGIINQELKDYFNFRTQKLIDAYQFLTNPENNQVTKERTDKFASILLRKPNLPDPNIIIINWNKENLEGIKTEMDDYHKLAFEQMMTTDKYYQDNNLNNDLISLILSKFSKKYPKNI